MTAAEHAALRARCRKAYERMQAVEAQSKRDANERDTVLHARRIPHAMRRGDWLATALCALLWGAIIALIGMTACRSVGSPLLHDHDQPGRVMADETANAGGEGRQTAQKEVRHVE
jgi:hypothetical protein